MELRGRRLTIPIDGYNPEQMKGAFYQGRVGHIHHAADLLAPRNTPIHAVEDGTIGRLFESAAGGLTVYQKDQSGQFVYYYAHLESYAEGLKDGDVVRRGQVIGYVGTSGNAPPNTPHLHFAISLIPPGGSVFKGQPIDPYEVYGKSAVGQVSFSGKFPGVFKTGVEAKVAPARNSIQTNVGNGIFKVENLPVSVKQSANLNHESQQVKRQIAKDASSRMPPLAPAITKVALVNLHTDPISKPPPKKSVANQVKNKQAPAPTPVKKVSKSAPAKKALKSTPIKKVAQVRTAHETKSAVKVAGSSKAHINTIRTKPDGSHTSKKISATPKSDNAHKLSKPAKPQKKPVVLRQLNKASTPKKRSGH